MQACAENYFPGLLFATWMTCVCFFNSRTITQVSIRISIGSKSNNVTFSRLGIFVVRPSMRVGVGRFGIISVYTVAQGCAGFQLFNATLGALTQPLGVTL